MSGAGAVHEISLVPVSTLDLPVLATLHGACFDEGWGLGLLGSILADPNAFGLLARHRSWPAGFLLCRVVHDEGEVLSLGVAPAFRRRGLARRLLDEARQRTAAAGARFLCLEVAEDNRAARALYRATGFAEVERRPEYYRRPGGVAVAALTLRLGLVRQTLRT